jgi:hypothetical protein
MRRPFVAMTTLAALAVVLHPPPCVSAATINVNIGSVTWFLGSDSISGNTNGRGHAARFNNPPRCAFTTMDPSSSSTPATTGFAVSCSLAMTS